MKYNNVYMFEAIVDLDECYLREATLVKDVKRDETSLAILGWKEYVVGCSFMIRLRKCIKEINRGYNFDIMRMEI